jgi:hypothetical protein
MSDVDELLVALESPDPEAESRAEPFQVIVIGGGHCGIGLAARLVERCGNSIRVLDVGDVVCKEMPLSMLPYQNLGYTLEMPGIQKGKGQRKARWNRQNRWR